MDLKEIQNLIKFVSKSGVSEVKLEVTGKIVKLLVDDSSPVEFGQPLFLVDPS